MEIAERAMNRQAGRQLTTEHGEVRAQGPRLSQSSVLSPQSFP